MGYHPNRSSFSGLNWCFNPREKIYTYGSPSTLQDQHESITNQIHIHLPFAPHLTSHSTAVQATRGGPIPATRCSRHPQNRPAAGLAPRPNWSRHLAFEAGCRKCGAVRSVEPWCWMCFLASNGIFSQLWDGLSKTVVSRCFTRLCAWSMINLSLCRMIWRVLSLRTPPPLGKVGSAGASRAITSRSM